MKKELAYEKKINAFNIGNISALHGLRPSNAKNDIADKTYVYEKDGFGGDFTIKLNGDGTFTYYEGLLSSYIGTGNWTFNGETLVLSDDKEYGRTLENRFKVVDGDLVFQAESSSNFTHIKAADGEKFSA